MKPSRTQEPSKRQFWSNFGPHFRTLLGTILAPKTCPNSGPRLDRFLGSVLVPKCGPNWPESSPKTSKRHRSVPRRAPSGCASAVLALYEKATKTSYFTMVLVPPSCPKRPEESQKALMEPSCTTRSDQKDSTKTTQAASSESGPKKTQKDTKQGARNEPEMG